MSTITPQRGPPKNRKQSPIASRSGALASGRSANLKLTIRLLPPSLGESEFLNQLATYYPHHATKIVHHYYIRGSYPLKPFEIPVYSRAYVSFNSENDLNEFLRLLKGKYFFDETNDLMVPIIEKSIYHKMIDSKKTKSTNATPKALKGKIENNEVYLKFLAFLNHEIEEFDLMKINKDLKKKTTREKVKVAEKSKAKKDKKMKLKEKTTVKMGKAKKHDDSKKDSKEKPKSHSRNNKAIATEQSTKKEDKKSVDQSKPGSESESIKEAKVRKRKDKLKVRITEKSKKRTDTISQETREAVTSKNMTGTRTQSDDSKAKTSEPGTTGKPRGLQDLQASGILGKSTEKRKSRKNRAKKQKEPLEGKSSTKESSHVDSKTTNKILSRLVRSTTGQEDVASK